MEFMDGGTITDWWQDSKDKPGSVNESFKNLASRLADAAEGVAAAHENGLIHRDIKPENLLYDATNDRIKVADFGLAKSVTENATAVTQTGDVIGTPSFMSPEQVDSYQTEGPTTDVYSLAATLYYLLVGKPRFSGNTPSVLRQIPIVGPAIPGELKKGLKQGSFGIFIC